jgi:hypothetical protein
MRHWGIRCSHMLILALPSASPETAAPQLKTPIYVGLGSRIWIGCRYMNQRSDNTGCLCVIPSEVHIREAFELSDLCA